MKLFLLIWFASGFITTCVFLGSAIRNKGEVSLEDLLFSFILHAFGVIGILLIVFFFIKKYKDKVIFKLRR